jgi:hypothetical protein
MAAPPPQSYPYDYLFKILIIGDASVGKVRVGVHSCLWVASCLVIVEGLRGSEAGMCLSIRVLVLQQLLLLLLSSP